MIPSSFILCWKHDKTFLSSLIFLGIVYECPGVPGWTVLRVHTSSVPESLSPNHELNVFGSEFTRCKSTVVWTATKQGNGVHCSVTFLFWLVINKRRNQLCLRNLTTLLVKRISLCQLFGKGLRKREWGGLYKWPILVGRGLKTTGSGWLCR